MELRGNTGACEVSVKRLTGQRLFEHATRGDQLLYVDTSFVAHALQHEDKIFGVDVAGSARRMRTAAESGQRRVHLPDAVLKSDQRVGKAKTASVMEVHGAKPVARNATHQVDDLSHLTGRGLPPR